MYNINETNEMRKGLINLKLVQKILCWQHTGFNVHTKVRATNKKEAERVGKYMIRPILSLQRLSFDENKGKVFYCYGKDSSLRLTREINRDNSP